MLAIKAKSEDLEDLRILIDIGIMDGQLEISDVKSARSKARKQTT